MNRNLAPILLAALAFCVPANAAKDLPALKDVFKDDFLVGIAINPSQFDPAAPDNAETRLVLQQFNAITAENVLKWGATHPSPNRYSFQSGDAYVDFGIKNKMFIIGHNLIWHITPGWAFKNEAGGQVDRDTLIQRMHDHISTVVGRYKGRIKGWDVVNEALNEEGGMRTNLWYQIIGEDYLIKAYQFAHEADPGAQLYYNEYGMENPAKRAGAVKLIKKLQAAGIPLAAVGIQGHYRLEWPATNEIAKTIDTLSALGLKCMITELDVSVLPLPPGTEDETLKIDVRKHPELNPYWKHLPDSVQQTLARRYADLFTVFLKHRAQITRVTFWNLTDGSTWLDGWPVRGRKDYPLLFDGHCHPKPAFYSVINVANPKK